MRFELQRVWVSLLAGFSSGGLGEEAAAAAALLSGLRTPGARLDGTLSPGAPSVTRWGCAAEGVGGGGAAAAHCEALAHMLALWGRGVPIPLP